jgi:hypothetical protein
MIVELLETVLGRFAHNPIEHEQSKDITVLAAALVEFQDRVTEADKEAKARIETLKGGSYEYSYSTLSECIATAREGHLLHSCGLAVTQKFGILHTPEGVRDTLITKLVHGKSGQWMRGEQLLHMRGEDMQAQGSATTYARRYAFCAILGISQKDDDGAAAVQSQREYQERKADPAMICPRCGKQLRRQKDPNETYCWRKMGGCGYDSIRDREYEESDERAGNYSTASAAPAPEPTSSASYPAPSLGDTGPKAERPHVPREGADAVPSDHEWAELRRIAEENNWPYELIKLKIDNRRKKGLSGKDIFEEMWALCSKKNTNYVPAQVPALAGRNGPAPKPEPSPDPDSEPERLDLLEEANSIGF